MQKARRCPTGNYFSIETDISTFHNYKFSLKTGHKIYKKALKISVFNELKFGLIQTEIILAPSDETDQKA